MLAQDVEGKNHRAHSWRSSANVPASADALDVIREEQRTWAEEHPGLLLKFTFPTKRRDAIRVSFRAIEKMEACASADFRQAFHELVGDCPFSTRRALCYLYMNYLFPYHSNIAAKGRHLLMVKVYEGKAEGHAWFIPLHEVLSTHKQASEVMTSGISLNDVQLVETYIVESTLAVHCETFACVGGKGGRASHGSDFGECTWIGGVALHIVLERGDERLEKSREFSDVPEAQFAELSETVAKMRLKRARKKANQKARKAEVAAVEAASERMAQEQQAVEDNLERKEHLVKPHDSLLALLESGAYS